MDTKPVKAEKAVKVERFTSMILRDEEEVNGSPRVRNLIRNWERELPMGESTNVLHFRAGAAAIGNLSAPLNVPVVIDSKAETGSFQE